MRERSSVRRAEALAVEGVRCEASPMADAAPTRLSVVVSASAEVQAPYEIARFAVTLSGVEATGAKATQSIRGPTDHALRYVDGLVATGRAAQKVVSTSVDPHWVYENNVNRHKGYRATTLIRFASTDVSHARAIQEALTELPQSQVASISYGFRDPEAVRERALEQAWEAVLRRWHHQARVMGADASAFRVETWSVDYVDRAVATKSAAPVDDQPGMASLRVSLSVHFTRT